MSDEIRAVSKLFTCICRRRPDVNFDPSVFENALYGPKSGMLLDAQYFHGPKCQMIVEQHPVILFAQGNVPGLVG